ncbi:uncharacterized protein [Diadema setosum]|uniref:uncharacterized protein n=1 Tax=Diadema setosum TaxID=31175 RepID=UPI003B3B5EA9
MTQNSRGVLHFPAIKLFIKQLGLDAVTSTLAPKGLVWLQGVLVSVDESKDEAILDDCTSTTRVDYSTTKKLRSEGSDIFRAGSHVMVIGRVVSLPPNSLIKAVKISPISNDGLDESAWPMEVIHQQQHLRQRSLQQLEEAFPDTFSQGMWDDT